MSNPSPRTNAAHEAGLVNAFVVPERQERTLQFLANPKKRSEILNRLCHKFDFRDKYATRIERQVAEPLADLLRSHGAGDRAYVIGAAGDIDGSELPLLEAIDGALAGPCGALVSCIPGRLALLVQEFPPGEIFLLSRN